MKQWNAGTDDADEAIHLAKPTMVGCPPGNTGQKYRSSLTTFNLPHY